MAARAAMMPVKDTPRRDPSIRLSRTPSQTSRVNLALKEGTEYPSHPSTTSPLAQSYEMSRSSSRPGFGSEAAESMSGSQYVDGTTLQRSASAASLSRSNTLRKQKSLSRKGSLKRSSSRRSVRAGAIGGITYDDTSGINVKSVFHTPIPTSGTPTEVLANRFQAWRKFLKDLISYFKEVQSSYESRSKQFKKLAESSNGLTMPPGFVSEGGLADALQILKNYHMEAIIETQKAREIENDVINQLSVLRSDLNTKIKEIKSLSGDFKNSISKEQEETKKVVGQLQEAIATVDAETKAMTGKEDPFLIRLGVERQVERQLDEENFLHRAYLNLEGSGRELETIVVGEIQKAFNAFATILKKEGDDSFETVNKLRSGPVILPKDLEWSEFIIKDHNFVTPDTPIRRAQDLEYPGKWHPSATEVRAGMLERKGKYLKSYTPGWYVLSPTHLHEFKSAEHVYTTPPAMSLYLPDQKLGEHSKPTSSSHKFILKGRQTGGLHRGHTWIFRAESHETMLEWYDAIKTLIESTGEDRNRYVQGHSRSFSQRSTVSTSSFDDDEADDVPFSNAQLYRSNSGAGSTVVASQDQQQQQQQQQQQRPQPGGRFPSYIENRSNLPVGTSSSNGSILNQDITTFDGGADQFEQTYTHDSDQESSFPSQLHSQSDTSRLGFIETQPMTNGISQLSTPNGSRLLVHQSPERPVEDSLHKVQPIIPHTAPIDTAPLVYTGTTADPSSIPHGQHLPTPPSMQTTEPSTEAEIEKSDDFETQPHLSRRTTDVSVSNLHVPGEYPKATKAL